MKSLLRILIDYIADNFTKILAIVTFFLLIIGYVEIATRYFLFKIKIDNYIDTSEILIGSVSQIFTSVFVCAFIIVLSILLSDVIKMKDFRLFLFELTILIIIGIIEYLRHKNDLSEENVVIDFIRYNIFLWGGIYFVKLMKEVVQSHQTDEAVLKLILKFLFSIVVVILINNTAFSLKCIIGNVGQQKTEFVFNTGNVIETSNTIILIGMTKKYVFFYNKEVGQTLIYPLAIVTEIKKNYSVWSEFER